MRDNQFPNMTDDEILERVIQILDKWPEKRDKYDI